MNLPTPRRLFSLVAFVLATSALCGTAYGKGSSVSYNPLVQVVEGNMPFSSTYTLTVMSPSDFPTGTSASVGFSVSVTTLPFGTTADALRYVSFSPSRLTFTGPGQSQTVTVTVAFPVLSLPAGLSSGTFSYQVTTTGWPSSIAPTDSGTSINATASVAPASGGTPPAVTITNPNDGTTVVFAANAFPAQIPFQFQATSTASDPITCVDANIAGQPVTLTGVTGLNTANVTANGSLTVPGTGLYAIQARATNGAGTGSDTNNITVSVSAPPPTVAITTPANGIVFTYRAGSPALLVPVNFTAQSSYGGIRTLAATVDGVAATFVPTGLGTLSAAGAFNLTFTSGGTHTVAVTTTDDNGSATSQTTFTINAVMPNPSVTILAPANNSTISSPVGATTIAVPFNFSAGVSNGFTIDSVAAALDGAPIALATTNGVGTAVATGSGTLAGVTAGIHTLTAAATSAGQTVTASSQFTVTVTSPQPPPSITILTPAAGATFTRYDGGAPASIPLSFTATSNAANGVITKVTATLDGAPVGVIANLNQKTVIGGAGLSVTTAGTHTLVVAAIDAYGTATATRAFPLTVLPGIAIRGSIFFDVDGDGTFDAGEFGLSGLPVTLRTFLGQAVATTTSAADGSYAFTKVPAGCYTIVAGPATGLVSTRGAVRIVNVGTADLSGLNIGFMLNFCAIEKLSAAGYTIGYWKNNLDKAIKGSTSGVQVSAPALAAATKAIGSLALAPYDAISEKAASALMGSTSSKPTDLLSKQLIAAEYNYENKAYLGGNANLTFLFVWWGEYVLSHPTSYSSNYILWAKDWFDAYNNSHGGSVDGPDPLDGSCSGCGSSGGNSYGSSDDSWYGGCR